ncbi:copper homeostasis periplasmic binding protein CopC [Erwinia sp. V71]|uniref:copper homeostasis periplasmic binding protein CopC n=1 Tax=Erwinia sp. V71 TaxID=3369424 RepID=UPI003F5F4929
MLHQMKKTLTVATLLASALLSQQVFAHAHLHAASPADKATVNEAPKEITLTFTEGVEPSFSGAKVTDSTGKPIATGKATSDKADNKVLHIPFSTDLTPGSYKVEWHVLSVDGHKTKGSYSFTQK